MTDSPIRTARITETGDSVFAVTMDVSGHALNGDEPNDGGKNLGPAPYDYLLAALGECSVMTIRWYARQQNWPLDKVEAVVTHRKENRTDIFLKDIILHGDALSDEQRAKLIEIAAKCPIQRTLEGTPVITTKQGDA